MDRYLRRDIEDLVVPNYQETSDTYPSRDMWSGWSMNSQKSVEKGFDFDVINNDFTGGLYSHMEMEIGTTSGEVAEEEEESKRLKKDVDCYYHSASSLVDFDGIQQMDDIFLSSILEDVPRNVNLHCYQDSDNDNNSPGSCSAVYLDGREVPMYHYDWETCHDMPLMGEEELMKISDLCEVLSTEEVVLQDLQRATEKLTDDTRKCFRNTFYRLAKNSQHKSESNNNNNLEEEDRTRNRNQKKTNSMDRAVANLTFNKMESNMRNLPTPKRLLSNQG